MKQFSFGILVVGLSLCVGVPVLGADDQERGAKILDMQLQRARHLKELEYQAEVLERQARIAKAQQQIDKTVGLESMGSMPSLPSAPKKSKPRHQPLPTIRELTATVVTFEFSNGETGVFVVGDQLPSGHRLDSISMVKGVVLTQGSSHYQVNFNW